MSKVTPDLLLLSLACTFLLAAAAISLVKSISSRERVVGKEFSGPTACLKKAGVSQLLLNVRNWNSVACWSIAGWLCVAGSACLLTLGNVEETIRLAEFNRPIGRVLASAEDASVLARFVVGLGSIAALPVLEILSTKRLHFADPWKASGPEWSFGGRPVYGHLLALFSIPGLCAAAWFAVTWGLIFAGTVWLLWIAWLQRAWWLIDDVGVVWKGSRFRWDQVTGWKVVFLPCTGDESVGGGDSYILQVTVGGRVFTCDDFAGTRRISEFFERYAGSKRVLTEPVD